MAKDSKSQGWWHTLPGFLTAVAAILTAVAGLVVALHQTGFFDGKPPPSSQRGEKTIAAPQEVPPKISQESAPAGKQNSSSEQMVPERFTKSEREASGTAGGGIALGSSAPAQSVHVPGSQGIGVIAGRDVTVTVNPKQLEQAKSTHPLFHLLIGTWKGVHRQAAVNGQLIATGYTRMLESGSYSYSGELSFQSIRNGRLAEVILLGQSAGTWKLDGNKFAVTLTDIKTQPKVLKEEGRPETDLSNPLTFPIHWLPKFEDTVPRGSSQEYEITELTPSTLKVRGKDLKGKEVFFEGIRQ